MQINYLADYPELVPVLAAWFQFEWGHFRPGSTVHDAADRVRTHVRRQDLPFALVALQGATALGTASLRLHNMESRPDLSPWLSSVYVTRDRRGQGIGAQLVRAVEHGARERGYRQLYLYTFTSQAFYERLGWRLLELRPHRGRETAVMTRLLKG